MSMRCRANRWVVVPAEMAMADPGATSEAARAAIASFSASRRADLASNPGSEVEGSA